MTMTPRAVIIVLSLAVAGCIAIPLPAPSVVKLEESPNADLDPLDPGEAVAVFGADEEESVYVAGCVQERLAKELPNNRVVPVAEARDLLFPWLEPGALPKDDAAVQALVARPAVAAKIRELKLQYLIEVGVDSTRAGIDTFSVFDAPMGVRAETESAHVSARVVDLEAACCRGGGSATATGVAAGAMYVVGIMFLPVIEGPACNRLSEALVQQLTPRMPSGP